ncbi:tetratricopeptide repeat protein (macronuclear) [Tetrahymena thermophila SB210]|uniref:Tetratricopeptide repeat protein n=1 Tax=Tetrahymena thermophila (strain SB210) TaxID=312017 RepID=I7LW95_TETTS|nr:tetratricopeptide repeat protein [Tetrahymena thermophila SB210]EAS01205.2 tetratricopeptide repeat protein [Tetrahymena thermophila SB210]|eukprot:XP_001021450.2 tetratricopeptide repeat protein [Tetrahymena thermophila SB210]
MLSQQQIKQFCSEIEYREDDFIKIQNKLYKENYVLKKISSIQSEDNLSKQYLLGSGGQAFVVLGQQIQTKQEVAIKFSKSSKQVFDEMTREQNTIQKIINFDFIVEVKQHFFLDEEKICIQIIELCSKSLFQEIQELRSKNQQYSYQQAISILFFAINALCEIHANGIIHFDIKPQNILITKEGKYKLADFGHSKNLQSNQTHMKSFGGGSVFYNSPEQYQANLGESPMKDLQMRMYTDIFSMGVTILEVIGVKIDFKTFNALQQDQLDSIDDKVGIEFKNIYTFVKYFMLQHKFNKRFSAIRLRQIFFETFEAEIEFQVEIERLQRQIEKYQPENSKQKNLKYLAYLYYFQSQVLEPKQAQQSILKSVSIIKEQNLNGQIEESIFLQMYGITLQKLCMFKESEQQLCKSHELLIKYYNNDKNIDIGFSYFQLYLFYYETRQYEKCLDISQKGLEIFELNFQIKHPYTSNFLNSLGNCYDVFNDFEKMQTFYKRALDMRLELYQGNHISISSSLNNMGLCYEKQNKYEEALKYYLKTQEMDSVLFKGNNRSRACTLFNIGITYRNLGDQKKQLEYYLKSLEMFQALYLYNHPDLAQIYYNLGTYYSNQGDNQNALAYFLKALANAEALYDNNHLDKALYLENVGRTYINIGKFNLGNEFLQVAKEMDEQLQNE